MPLLVNYFNELDDPRTSNAPRHKFCDLMTISLLCALCGGETAVDMEHFARSKEDFLREFLELPLGLPSHDAFSRLFQLMKPDSFQAFFEKFRADLQTLMKSKRPLLLMVRSCVEALIKLPRSQTLTWSQRLPMERG